MNSKNLSNYILPYSEHCGANKTLSLEEKQATWLTGTYYEKYFPKVHRGKNNDMRCFLLQKHDGELYGYNLETGYFIGVDWVEEGEVAIYIEPKLNVKEGDAEKSIEIDYLSMLFEAIKNTESDNEVSELFLIKWKEKPIEITQKQDLLTPFLVVEFLAVLKKIVRKGLKKSYYKVENNLQNRIKGKVITGKNIKQNIARNKNLYTYCSFDEFGLNNVENRLLKKALIFVKKYLPIHAGVKSLNALQNTFNLISPAFDMVSDEIELSEIKHSQTNAFYKEYADAIRLAKLILKRFGFNISNTTVTENIHTPPFWIDMSKLFELYVLSKLRETFGNEIIYHFKKDGNELDFLLSTTTHKIVIDAKYIPSWKWHINHDNVRQLSGYARLKKVYDELRLPIDKIIDCLIIYPDMTTSEHKTIDINNLQEIEPYANFFKLGISLPTIR